MTWFSQFLGCCLFSIALSLGSNTTLALADDPEEVSAPQSFFERLEFQLGNDFYQVGDLLDLPLVAGDVFALGFFLQLREEVQGDVLALAQNLLIESPIADDLRAIAGLLVLQTKIGGDVLIFGKQVKFAPESEIAGTVSLKAQQVELAGKFVGDVEVHATEITLGENLQVQGEFKYSAPQAIPAIAEFVQGRVIFEQIAAEQKNAFNLDWFGGLMSLIAGTLVLALLGRSTNTLVKPLRKKFWWIFLSGLGFILLPIIVIFLFITQLGILLGGILALIWLLFLLLAKALAGFVLGTLLWPLPARPDLLTKFNRLGLGTLFLVLLALIPYAEILQIFIFILTLGLLVYLEFNFLKKMQSKAEI